MTTTATECYAELTRDHEERIRLAVPAPRPPADRLLDPRTGTVAIGRYADGTEAQALLWDADGAVHGRIAADTGAGSSTLIDHLLAAEHTSPLIESWAAAPYGIRPGLADHTASTRGETLDLLREAVALLNQRLADTDFTSGPYAPTPERPLISITLADWPRLAAGAPQIRHLAGEIACAGRPAGIGLRAEGKGELPTSIPLQAHLRHVQLIVLGTRHTPGLGVIGQAPFAFAQKFRTWAPQL
ncbi:hypothetical protein ABZW30_13250 [Kitasatospora sp. NPDC004669]|uniref:hypothetical protein n=1 Tax=Kitasatospora sp. NPDC004669 TaxID=3154555 RepID=UPI0033A137EF